MELLLISFLMLMELAASLNAQELASFDQEGTALYREIARKIGLKRDTAPEPPAIYLERLRTLVLSDRVAFYFNVDARLEHGQILLSGEVERPEFKTLVREVFQQLGIATIQDTIEVLPNLNSQSSLFGIVVVPYVLTYSRPDMTGIPMDEALYGEPVYILKELPKALLIKTFSGYWGYAVKESIRRTPPPEFLRFVNGEKVLIRQDFETNVNAQATSADKLAQSRSANARAGSRANLRHPRLASNSPTFIPSGSRLVVEKWGLGKNCWLLNPAGGSFPLPKAICRKADHQKEMTEVVACARSFLKTPYNLGGKNSHTGIDCSGLIQLSYRAIGINLARDAKQQYLGGNLIPPYLAEALLPGDVLYFMNSAGQVDHTALYLGDQQIIHATGSQVQIQSLNPASAKYLKRFTHEFIGAKRFGW